MQFEKLKRENFAYNPSLNVYDFFKDKYVYNSSLKISDYNNIAYYTLSSSSINLAAPSTFPYIIYVKNSNINVNELEKYPAFLEVKQDKKIEDEELKKRLFDDTNNENLYKKENIFSRQSKLTNSSLNPFFYQKYLDIENKNIERQ